MTDDDCEDGSICLCGIDVEHVPNYPQCIPSECDSDADCEEGFSCALAIGNDGCGWRQRMACHTARDTCTTNADCGDTSGAGGCFPNDTGAWECIDPNCVIGRPFIVGGELTFAPSTARADWAAPRRTAAITSAPEAPRSVEPAPAPDSLSHAERLALRDHWSRNASLEHASVASFARFALQLMHLGAPPTLLRGATAAMNDEIDHAERCFALASKYGATKIGPDRLPLSPEALAHSAPLEIVEAVIVEACIGETLAALEAAVALEHATDPDVRATLTVVARDEARHAALGWETLRWVHAGADAPMRGALESLLRDAMGEATSRAERMGQLRHAPALTAHGMLPENERRRVALDGLREVVAPVAASLWASAETRSNEEGRLA